MAETAHRVLLVWGGGGHGRVVAEVARAAGWRVAGYADANPAKRGCVAGPGGELVVATEEELLAALGAGGPLPAGAGAVAPAVGDNERRLECLRLAGDRGAPPLVHPSAVVSPSASLGRGTAVLPLAAVNAGAVIGAGVIVNTGAVVEHDCVLEDGVHVSPNATLAGGVRVGTRSWIGAGAVVRQEIRIGADAVVGAGAVVVRDVPAGVTVVGVPAQPIRREH